MKGRNDPDLAKALNDLGKYCGRTFNTWEEYYAYNRSMYARDIKFVVNGEEYECDVYKTHINDASYLANDIYGSMKGCRAYKDVLIGYQEDMGFLLPITEQVRKPDFIVTSELLHEVRAKAIDYFFANGQLKIEEAEFPKDTYEIIISSERYPPAPRWIPKKTLDNDKALYDYVANYNWWREVRLQEIYPIRKTAKKLS